MLARTAHADFAPSCAVLGGILGQDVLAALGGTEMPIANFLAFDGDTHAGDIYALGITLPKS